MTNTIYLFFTSILNDRRHATALKASHAKPANESERLPCRSKSLIRLEKLLKKPGHCQKNFKTRSFRRSTANVELPAQTGRAADTFTSWWYRRCTGSPYMTFVFTWQPRLWFEVGASSWKRELRDDRHRKNAVLPMCRLSRSRCRGCNFSVLRNRRFDWLTGSKWCRDGIKNIVLRPLECWSGGLIAAECASCVMVSASFGIGFDLHEFFFVRFAFDWIFREGKPSQWKSTKIVLTVWS